MSDGINRSRNDSEISKWVLQNDISQEEEFVPTMKDMKAFIKNSSVSRKGG